MPQSQNNCSDEVVFLSRHGDQFMAVVYSAKNGFHPVSLCRQKAADIYNAGKDWAMRRAGLVHDHWTIEYAAGNRLLAAEVAAQ